MVLHEYLWPTVPLSYSICLSFDSAGVALHDLSFILILFVQKLMLGLESEDTQV